MKEQDMATSAPVFVADTCICGLSVVKSLWDAGMAGNAVFMADYAVNPLGVKSDSEITAVVERWFGMAQRHSDTLVMACNTLSVHYRQLEQTSAEFTGLERAVSMVDCLEALARAEAGRLANRRVLVIGTEYTASQGVYPHVLGAGVPGVRVSTFGATDLERKIARFQPLENERYSAFDGELRAAIENADVAILACTCFPMVIDRFEALFPGVLFLDPGDYCSDLLGREKDSGARKLHLQVSGEVVSNSDVLKFARSYLGHDAEIAC
jgi:glutamate racemase